MSSAAITPIMRTQGWNTEFLATPNHLVFAGLYQHHEHVFTTFRDILDEMRLCFEIPYDDERLREDDWEHVAFGLVTAPVGDGGGGMPCVVEGRGLDMLVPSLPGYLEASFEDRAVAQYCVFEHRNCSLNTHTTLKSHIQAGCARHIPSPTRRIDRRYLPPKKTSSDPRFAAYPLRKTTRHRRNSHSPSKRSASGSVSPDKNTETGQDDIDLSFTVAPLRFDIPNDRIKHVIANFRASCLVLSTRCAVTGTGRPWCPGPGVGPSLQACHIVPQQHYHTYPSPLARDDEDDEAMWSTRRLTEAWERTWAARNGILLLSHLHELFDARLFSIHPETLQIRVFVPYDVILPYHGRTAKVPRSIDRIALRHHYDMCCIENMAATMPFVEQVPTFESLQSASGALTPLELRPGRSQAGDLAHSGLASQSESGVSRDPAKRPRTELAPDEAPGLSHGSGSFTTDTPASTLYSASPPRTELRLESDEEMELISDTFNESTRVHKRNRSSVQRYKHAIPSIESDGFHHLTDLNREQFLAHVNGELLKVARRRVYSDN